MGERTVYDVLGREHRKIRTLLRKLHQTEAGEARVERQLTMALLRHGEGERHVLYRPLKEFDRARDVVTAAEHEHATLAILLRELVRLRGAPAPWREKLRILTDHVQEHVRREEQNVFPLARELLGEDQDGALARDLEDVERDVEIPIWALRALGAPTPPEARL